MTVDAEKRKSEVTHLNMHREEDPRMFKIPNDPRVTRVGGLPAPLVDRRASTASQRSERRDVTRRPAPVDPRGGHYVDDWARQRLSIKPGITGLWQVLGRSDITFGEMTQLDYLYVTGWSLKQDVRLILLTIPSLFRPRQAF